MKIDLHVHSKHSTRPSQWILQKLGCPESFTEPRVIYDIAKARGMDMVTISDHNSIGGALEIAHLPDAFVSEEITTYFPDVGCKIHVLALDIDESIHEDIQKVRPNIYELVPYLREKNIVHVCAHPLFAVNDRLTLEHFEQLLLLFTNFECNGTRDGYQNDVLKAILSSLTPETMDELANKHGFAPYGDTPWKKNITGGSDDHSALNIASMHTVVDGAADLESFKHGILSGQSQPDGRCAGPNTLAMNLYSIAYQFYKNKFNLDRYVNKDIFLKCVDRFLSPDDIPDSNVSERVQAFFQTRKYIKGRIGKGGPRTVQQVLRLESARLILDDKRLSCIAAGAKMPDGKAEKEWFRFVTRASNRVLTVFADKLLSHASGANIFDIFQTVGSAGALYSVTAPYFVSYGVFKKDRRFTDDAAARFGAGQDRCEPKVGHYTDTFFDINGVAKTLQRSVRIARANGKDMTIVTSHQDQPPMDGVKNFAPVGVYDLPEYPELKLFYPPALEMLDHAYEQNFTHIHASTPGPIGLTALMISRILKLPLYGTYHTQIPQYVGKLTNDSSMEDLTWKFILWFYGQCDITFAPSQATADELIAHGLPAEKVRVYPRGVDTVTFHPANRNGAMAHYTQRGGAKFLYVGRVSKEKNLDLLFEAFEQLSARRDDVTLFVTGDGPYRAELENRAAKLPVVFTGYKQGDDLAALYASADAFVFPSRSDTFGNVVLEAQASGVPAVVTDEGGPRENVLNGKTGFIVDGEDPAPMAAAMEKLAADETLRQSMGKAARAYMEERSFERAFLTTWDMQYSVVPAPAKSEKVA